ncbi:MAG TPA: LysR family transcriptional regulator [Actinomycetes bacterium]|nr:LysR family transcriptional regulator [Actinomycetes bacterium]
MRDVTLRQLHFLAETVHSGSLAGAAERLHLTGPAIAQQLRLLERRVGLPLLERGPGGQRPTEAGRLLVEAAARIDAELEACEEALAGLRDADTGQVRVGAVSTAKYFAPHVLAAFHELHPGVSVSISVGNRDEVLQRLESFEVDLAIMGRPPRGLEAEQEVFGEHPYVVIAPPAHPMVGRRLTLAEVAEETFLVREPGSGTRLHLDSLFAAGGLQPVVGMEITSNETIKQAVIAGLGIALLSEHTVCAEVQDGRLAVLDVTGLPIVRNWLVVRMSRRAVSPAARALWDFVVQEGASRLPSLRDPGGRMG